MFNQSCPVIELWPYFLLITLKHLAVFKILESIDFCIFIRHSLALFSRNSSCILFRTSSEYPPNTSTMMLICLTTYPGYLSFICHLSGAYFVVFSFFPLFPIHGDVISMSNTSFFSLSTMYTHIHSVWFDNCALSIHWNVPISFRSVVSVNWLRLHRWVPWRVWFNKIHAFQHLKEW